MSDKRIEQLSWLPEICELVHREMEGRRKAQAHNRPAMEAERDAMAKKIKGWAESLAKTDLNPILRVTIEDESAAALDRIEEIDLILAESCSLDAKTAQVVDEGAILRRLSRLEDVLANECPTLGNLELSLHIDRIVCHRDGRVELRTCKIGSFTGALDLLLDGGAVSSDSPSINESNGEYQPKPRRRGRVRVDFDSEVDFDLEAAANFAADPDRFSALPDEWFWIDEFAIPEKGPCWSEENAQRVLQRYREIEQVTGEKPSLNALAREFGKSRPTITRALDNAMNGATKAPTRHRRQDDLKVKGNPEIENEIARLHQQGKLDKEIAAHFGVHRNTIARSLDRLYAEQGLERPDGRSKRKSRKGD